jgi:SAM-dependent methyltransferase
MQVMKIRTLTSQISWALVPFALAACVAAQAPTPQQYEPQVGQEGKDVVWVPMPDDQLEKLLDMAKVTPADFVMDLGSGDGRTVIAAAKRGARAMGVEFNPDLVALSEREAKKAGVAGRTAFVQGDLFETDLSRATVITLFLLDEINMKLRPTLLSLKPGTRVLSNTFKMGDWEPDGHEWYPPGCFNWCSLYLWIVPARVEGSWRAPQGKLALKQKYQAVTGTFRNGGKALPISSGRLSGEAIRFTAGGAEYRARVDGNVIEGTVVANGAVRPWKATRHSP